MPQNSSSLVLCDAHVHIYDCFDHDVFFDATRTNFNQKAVALNQSTSYIPVLLLSEAKQDRWFSKLKENLSSARNWSFSPTDEPTSLTAQHTDGYQITIINGRQIVTEENIEVLALATNKILTDGKPAEEVIDWAIDNNAIIVIPWGFGKWWGKRGKVVLDILKKYPPEHVFLGDNSGRPWFLGKPKHFGLAENEQRHILPGSDPLPFSSETARPGSVGFYFTNDFDRNSPAKCIHNYLKKPTATIENYMHLENLLPFLKNQFAMQIKKRK